MVWWQGLLVVLGLAFAAAIVGLAVSYLILRLQKKPWPYSWRSGKNNSGMINSSAGGPATARQDGPVKEEDGVKAGFKVRSNSSPLLNSTDLKAPIKSAKSAVLTEVESNLATANAPWSGKLVPFQTKAWDANKGRLDSLIGDVQEDLIEAYTDMQLANTLVWLSMDAGHRSKDLDESYLKLCNKIAERLTKVKPSLMRSGA